MTTTVEYLMQNPFEYLPIGEKVNIVKDGRPRVPMVNNAPGPVTPFLLTHYDTYPLLAGSALSNRLFCWPCLLFSKNEKWNVSGIVGVPAVVGALKKHECEEIHKQCLLKLLTFSHFCCAARKAESLELPLHNELVRRNREIIKRLIDIIFCLLAQQESLTAGGGGDIRIEDCIQGLELLKHYDSRYSEHLDEAVQLLRIEPKILPDLINAMCRTYFESVKKELKLSTYVSLILSEHSEMVDGKSLVSAVLRYFRAGRICERFVGYMHVKANTTQDLMTDRIMKFLEDCDISDRLIALAMDGGVAPSSELPDLLSAFNFRYPYSFYLPWYSHRLDNVLLQSVMNLRSCLTFFRYVKRMGLFFRDGKQGALDAFMCKKFPILRNINWYEESQLPKMLHTYRAHFIQFFENFATHFSLYSPEDLVSAAGFCEYLKSFDAVFLLEVFARVFDLTATLNAILKSDSPEEFFRGSVVKDLIESLRQLRRSGFEPIWDHLSTLGLTIKVKTVKDGAGSDARVFPKSHYQGIFESILHTIIMQVSSRFAGTKKLSFFNMLNCDSDGNLNCAGQHVMDLVEVHTPFFRLTGVATELKIFNENAELKGWSVYELLQIFHDRKLSAAFADLFKVACMILTTPCKPPSKSKGGDKLEAIERNSCLADVTETSCNVSLLRTEFDFFQTLRKGVFFYDSVIFQFQERNNILKLLFK